jgi:hypothetical protein
MSAAMLEQIFDTVTASNADTNGVWIAGLALAGCVLRRTGAPAPGYRTRVKAKIELPRLFNDLLWPN